MIEAQNSYKATDGTFYETKYEAWKHQLFLCLRSYGVDNDAYALAIIKSFDKGRPEAFEEMAQIMEGLADTAPPPPHADFPQ